MKLQRAVFQECRELKLSLFECPDFLFIFTGTVTIGFILATYFVARYYYELDVVVVAITVVSTVMLIINFMVHQGTMKILRSRRAIDRANQDLATALGELREANRVREEYTSMMVHDLRSPLTGTRMLIEMLQSELNQVTESFSRRDLFDRSLGLVRDNVERILKMVSDLLTVARIEAGKLKLDRKQGDVTVLLRKTVQLYEPFAANKKITLSYHLGSPVPPIWFDERSLVEILENLITNALKFTDSGGRIHVQVFRHQAGADLAAELSANGMTVTHPLSTESALVEAPTVLVFTVSDTGWGLTPEKQRALFARFGDTVTPRDPKLAGTGLGLSICKGLTRAHGGTIGAVSTPGKGSTFYFTLPASDDQRAN